MFVVCCAVSLLVAGVGKAEAQLGGSFEGCAKQAPHVVLAEGRQGPAGKPVYVVLRAIKGGLAAGTQLPDSIRPSQAGQLAYLALDARKRAFAGAIDDGCSDYLPVVNGLVTAEGFPFDQATPAQYEARLKQRWHATRALPALLQACMLRPQEPCAGLPAGERSSDELRWVGQFLQTELKRAQHACKLSEQVVRVRARLMPDGSVAAEVLRPPQMDGQDPASGPACVRLALQRPRFRSCPGVPTPTALTLEVLPATGPADPSTGRNGPKSTTSRAGGAMAEGGTVEGARADGGALPKVPAAPAADANTSTQLELQIDFVKPLSRYSGPALVTASDPRFVLAGKVVWVQRGDVIALNSRQVFAIHSPSRLGIRASERGATICLLLTRNVRDEKQHWELSAVKPDAGCRGGG